MHSQHLTNNPWTIFSYLLVNIGTIRSTGSSPLIVPVPGDHPSVALSPPARHGLARLRCAAAVHRGPGCAELPSHTQSLPSNGGSMHHVHLYSESIVYIYIYIIYIYIDICLHVYLDSQIDLATFATFSDVLVLARKTMVSFCLG